MISVYVTVVAILGSNAQGQGVIECSFSGSSETRQCFGAVGQPLIFHLPNTENVEIRLTKDAKHRILKAISDRLVDPNEDFLRQTGNIYNRTITFGNAMKRHSGDYLLEEFTAEGKNLKNVNLHLKIHAPVSVPAVSQTCLSPEKMTVTCSSEGDAVEFILTLDNQLLLQTRNHNQSLSNSTAEEPSVSRISIDLHGKLTGNFMCQVRNNVSEHETVLNLTACKGFEGVYVAALAAVILLFLFMALSFVLFKICKKSRPIHVINGSNEEIIYTDVKVLKGTRRTGPNLHDNTR